MFGKIRMPIDIRAMKYSDLENGFFKVLKQLTYVGSISTNRDRWKELFESNKRQKSIFVAYDTEADKVVGIGSIFIEFKFIHDGRPVGHIEDIVIDKNYRGIGLGKKIVQSCIKIAKDHNCYKIILDASRDVEFFYNRLGFKEAGICLRLEN